ncbi:MAG: phosphoenolpyruvate--protein phosphotransferase [Sutterella parvirubra]|uniref:Phosphoenolpyruvate-protein phosphotransferase n=1 Tax=Sutterella parvirubra YIT 11816 TaxID=762967 RepID=H3KHK8_9BURK|nr:phosphoenolpyruvate--protein phosphotransferase [Sutterella parvirubra]EHY30403.1 phosphoenolpyruvate-protein phosphotransferase [Sutterella parvirubra YIT 11816]MCI7709466.1 phosphoenolpyruvate--protein phosphotransferase [Sutterella parvirubra]MDY5200507.1 phosphoenolpyruvate--protein phosphotransferase [Sutterella parvirubra]
MTEELQEEAQAPVQLDGLTVYPGVAAGTVQIFASSDLDIPQFAIEKSQVRGEILRLRNAVSAVDKQMAAMTDTLDEDLPAEAAAFIEVHRTILKDPTLLADTNELIKTELVNAEWALSLRLERVRRDFEQIDDDYLRQRVEDIAHVVQRVQRTLAGRRSEASLLDVETVEDKVILVSDRLDPTDMLQLRERDDLDIVGLVLEEGSVTSHSAILAHSLEIPTLVGVTGLRESAANNQRVLLDADAGVIELNPTPEQLKDARLRMREQRRAKRQLRKLKDVSAVTTDGTDVVLAANIALPDDLVDVHRVGASGIGLFRTEFLYLNREDLPGEEEQFLAYQKIFRSMRGKSVVIRTADLGGDKMLSRESMALLRNAPVEESNPALGLRGIRFSFAYPELLTTQLRAILRAGAGAVVNILLPLVTSPVEVRRFREILEEVRASLEAEEAKLPEAVNVGGMVEVPAAVAVLRDLIPVLDFFSLGTNDLVQYTLAVDRTNAAVSDYYEECHPAVLRLIAETIRRVTGAGKSVSVCGEMAGRTDLTEFFLGLGCRVLSMDASRIPSVKNRVLQIDSEDATDFSRGILHRRSAESVRRALTERETRFQVNDHAEESL